MIAYLAKSVLGKIPSTFLVWILIALIGANVAQGYLLKRAWTKNAQAVLACENAALRDAKAATDAVNRELIQIQAELTEAENKRILAGEEADREIAKRIHEKEVEHAQEITDMEIATNEIADDEFFCASEPVTTDQLVRMRDATARYNKTRTGASGSRNANRNTGRQAKDL